jgi:hypothetical protein
MSVAAIDPAHDNRHRLQSRPDARESWALLLSLPQERLGLILYTWVTAASVAGAALMVYGPRVGERPVFELVDGIQVPLEQDFDDWQVGPVTWSHPEPLRRAVASFAGEQAGLRYDFEALHPAYNFASHGDGCPWYMADDRFEQGGRARGELRLGASTISFETTGQRDHSWGTRNWGGTQHWKWIYGHAGPETSFHLFESNSLGRHELRGYVFREGQMSELRELSEVTFELNAKGLMQRSYAATLHDHAGRATRVEMETHSSFVFEPHADIILNETGMSLLIDGAPGNGHVEMAWPPAYVARATSDPATAAHLLSS